MYRLAKLSLRQFHQASTPHALLYEQFEIRRQRARQIVKALVPQRRIIRANPESLRKIVSFPPQPRLEEKIIPFITNSFATYYALQQHSNCSSSGVCWGGITPV